VFNFPVEMLGLVCVAVVHGSTGLNWHVNI